MATLTDRFPTYTQICLGAYATSVNFKLIAPKEQILLLGKCNVGKYNVGKFNVGKCNVTNQHHSAGLEANRANFAAKLPQWCV